MTLHTVVAGSALLFLTTALMACERPAVAARGGGEAAGTAGAAAPAPAAYDIAKTEAWRAEQEVKLKAPEGWLSVAGLHFLKPGVNLVGGDPASDVPLPADAAPAKVGRILVEGETVAFEPEPGADVTVDGRPVTARLELEGPAGGTRRAPVRLVAGKRVLFHLHHSGDRLAVRLRDPESPIRRGFTGLHWFDVDPAWQIAGRWVPFAQPRKVEIQNVLGDTLHLDSPGEVEATIGGTPVKLLALTEKPGELWFIFTDATAPKDTYRIRFLYAPLAADAPAGTAVPLDFNRAYNPPCAYNPFTTCPLPPPQNRLSVRVPAGERAYHTAS